MHSIIMYCFVSGRTKLLTELNAITLFSAFSHYVENKNVIRTCYMNIQNGCWTLLLCLQSFTMLIQICLYFQKKYGRILFEQISYMFYLNFLTTSNGMSFSTQTHPYPHARMYTDMYACVCVYAHAHILNCLSLKTYEITEQYS